MLLLRPAFSEKEINTMHSFYKTTKSRSAYHKFFIKHQFQDRTIYSVKDVVDGVGELIGVGEIYYSSKRQTDFKFKISSRYVGRGFEEKLSKKLLEISSRVSGVRAKHLT